MNTFFLSLIFAVSSKAHAHSLTDSRCYEIPIDQPQLSEEPHDHGESAINYEVWCYQDVDAPRTGKFIYNADERNIRPELSILQDENGDLTHASLLQGELTYHKVNQSDFIPFSIPIQEPTGLPRVIHPRIFETDTDAGQVFASLLRARDTRETPDLSTQEGELRASTVRKPWRGYWWPQKGQTLAPTFRKYDNVRRLNGENSNAVGWEASRHVWNGAWWEGHCNGWAAAAIMRPEPRVTRVHSGVEFGVGNQKGLLAEKDYCAKAAFFGGRTLSHNDEVHIQYISAQKFHTTLRYYIGQLNKPVAMDYQSSSVVDNHVVSGYNMDIQNQGNGRLRVRAVLTMHKYDGKNTDSIGPAPSYTRTYNYMLITDSSNTIVSSYWIGGNPDFIWVPLATATCSKGNSHVNEQWVQSIIYR